MIKVIWAREWDDLLARDKDGVLLAKMNDTLDGDYQRMAVSDGATIREQFFGPDPAPARAGRAPLRRRARQAAARRPRLPQGLRGLRRGGRAQGRADRDPGQDGQGLDARPGHRGPQRHPPGQEAHRRRAEDLPRPPRAADPRRQAQGRAVLPPRARRAGDPVHARAPAAARRIGPAAHGRATAAAGADGHRVQRVLRRLGPAGQHDDGLQPAGPQPGARPADRRAASCRSSPTRRARSAWTRSSRRSASTTRSASATRRSTRSCCSATSRRRTASCSRRASPSRARWPRSRPPAPRTRRWGEPMIPFYIFYSMFGLQRTGDQVWAFGDARGRGFMMGATAGRTTLTGEGLQHDDGHSPRPGQHGPEHPRLRPGLRLRARDHRARGDRPHVRRARRGRLLLRHALQRELADARPCRRASRRASCAACTGFSARRSGERRVQILAAGPILLQALRAQDMLRRAVRRRGRRLERDQLPAAAQRGARRRALEPPPSRRRAAGPLRAAVPRIRRRDRSSPPPTT